MVFLLIDAFMDLPLTAEQRRRLDVEIRELDAKNKRGRRLTVLLNSTSSFEASFTDMVGVRRSL
jgi:hypothetical protein